MSLIFSFLAFGALYPLDYFLLKASHGIQRILGICCVIMVSILLPFWLPTTSPILLFLAAMIVFNKIIKTLEIAYSRVYDPAMVESFPRYLFWSMNFPDSVWPASIEQRQHNRKQGQKRLLRSIPKWIALVCLWLCTSTFPILYEYYYLKMLCLGLSGYFVFAGLVDCVIGIMMQTGIYFQEIFNNPLMSSSPREMWGKRWNLYFRDVAHRNIFLPLGGTKRPLIAVCAVFATSALLHEYLIFVSQGFSMFGYMSLFFLLQCLATIAQTTLTHWLAKKSVLPNSLGIMLHQLWLLLTLPLLAEPMLCIF